MQNSNNNQDMVSELFSDLFSKKTFAFLLSCFNIFLLWDIAKNTSIPSELTDNQIYFALMVFGTYNLFLNFYFVLNNSINKLTVRIIQLNLVFLFGFGFLVIQRDFIVQDYHHEKEQDKIIQELQKKIKSLESSN
jgi:thiol:disulfide interchange protein